MKKTVIFLTLVKSLFAFYIGVGGISACPSANGAASSALCSYSVQKPLYTFLKKEAPNINSLSMWITREWQENWYPVSIVNEMIKSGYTPIFIFYWFRDDISKEFIQKNRQKYFKALDRFIKYLQKIEGKKIVILNPEFNENGVESYEYFDMLQSDSILKIKLNVKETLVGICPGDFGNYKKIWDENNWKLYMPSMQYSAKLSDFIAFQEMRALTKNRYNDIYYTPLRALAFATYLHQTFKKPTFLAYLAISSYKNEKLQSSVFKNIQKLIPLFKRSAKLIGINFFHYIDVPEHTGYFGIAERYFGLKYKDGRKKSGFKYILKIK